MRPFTLVVPDIHQRLDKLEGTASGLENEAKHVVYLGDYYDSHDAAKYSYEHVNHWLASRLKFTNWDMLIGNHDAQYLFNGRGFKCSGYQGDAVKADIQRTLNSYFDKFKLHTWVGPYLLSHAGFHPWTLVNEEVWRNTKITTTDDLIQEIDLEYVPIHLATAEEEALKAAWSGDFHWLFYPGVDVGGQGYGGCTWMRWHRYVPIPGLPQIMGHTWQKDGKVKTAQDKLGNMSYMLDTGLKHVAKIYHDNWQIATIEL